jgi:hypothetical protein
MSPATNAQASDKRRRRGFLTQLLPGALLGMIAVAITGFLGYSKAACQSQPGLDLAVCLQYDPNHPGGDIWVKVLDDLFARPWVLFAYLLMVMALLYWQGVSGVRRYIALAFTGISAVIVVWLYFKGIPSINLPPFDQLIAGIKNLIKDPGTYVILNMLAIAILAGSEILQWLIDLPEMQRRNQPAPSQRKAQAAGQGQANATGAPSETSELKASGLLAGDLIVRGGILLILAFCFLFNIQRILPGAPQDLQGTGQFQLDLGLGLGALIVGGFLLWGVLLERGVEDEDEAQKPDEGVDKAPRPATGAQDPIGEIALQVILTLLAVLISPFERLLPFEVLAQGSVSQQIAARARMSLLMPLAFLLNLAAVGGIGLLALATRNLLHLPQKPSLQFGHGGQLGNALSASGTWLSVALLATLLAVIGLALSLRVFAVRQQETSGVSATKSQQGSTATKWPSLLRLGYLTLITFWVPSLVLFGLNEFILLLSGFRDQHNINPSADVIPFRLQPFLPGPATALSLLVLVISGIILLGNKNSRKRLLVVRWRGRDSR